MSLFAAIRLSNPRCASRHRAGFVVRSVALLFLALGVTGCHSPEPEPVPVTPAKGKVTYQGRPAAGAMLYFVPVDAKPDSIRPRALTNEKGEYELNAYGGKFGAPEGDYTVTITWTGPVKAKPKASTEEDEPAGQDFFQGKYANPKTTPFKVSIRAGSAELPTIQLPTR